MLMLWTTTAISGPTLVRLSKCVKQVCNFFQVCHSPGVKQGRPNPYRVIGISWSSQELLDAARSRARALGISFSSYVNRVVERELERGGDFVLSEKPGVYRAGNEPDPSQAGASSRHERCR